MYGGNLLTFYRVILMLNLAQGSEWGFLKPKILTSMEGARRRRPRPTQKMDLAHLVGQPSKIRTLRWHMYGIGWAVWGWNLAKAQTFFLSPKRPNGLEDPPCLLCNEYGAPLSVTKRPGRDVHHSPLSSAEAENVLSYTSALPISLNGVDRDFPFTNTRTSERRLILTL